MSEPAPTTDPLQARWAARGEGPPREARPTVTNRRSVRLSSPPGLHFSRSGTFEHLTEYGDAWTKQNCLSIDGGGIRGYWALLVLEKLMDHIDTAEVKAAAKEGLQSSRPGRYSSFHPHPYPPHATQLGNPSTISDRPSAQRYLPCHYFDYICGSSTGALIALMLGTFRMTVEDCMNEYETLGTRIFGNPRKPTMLGIPLFAKNKYDEKMVEKVYKKLTERREARGVQPPAKFAREKGVCQTCVTTLAKTVRPIGQGRQLPAAVGQYRVIRSYPAQPLQRTGTGFSDPCMARDWLVQEVARAATAAEFFFKEFQIDAEDGQKMILKDGGMGQYNNPTMFFLQDVIRLHGNKASSLGTVVSIGTARKGPSNPRTIFSRVRNRIDEEADPEGVHKNVYAHSQENGYDYFRFNDPGALDMRLDDCRPRTSGTRTLADIRSAFETWYTKRHHSVDFAKCAKKLVQRRRERAHADNADVWDRFATASSYECCNEHFLFKSQLKDHLRAKHFAAHDAMEINDTHLDQLEDQGQVFRKFWDYRRYNNSLNGDRA